MDDTKILTAIASLYDCIPEPTRWPDTLGDLAKITGSVMAIVSVRDTTKNIWRFSAAHGDPAALAPLYSTYAEHMPFTSIIHRQELDVPLSFEGLCDLYGPDGYDVWTNSRIHQEWVIPHRLRTGVNLNVLKQDNRLGFLNTMTRDDEPLSPGSLARASTLAPHVRRSVTIGDLLETEMDKIRIFQEVIDNLAHPVVIVTHDMRIVYANAAAEILLRAEISVRQTDGRIAFTYVPAHDSITHAVALGHRDEFLLGASGMNVPLVKIERPSVAHILPLTRRTTAGISNSAGAAIFIASPGSNPTPAIAAIAALFGLTAAEKRVATLIAEGKTRGEIALAHGVSDHTVKAQLGVIFDKTNTRDQRQLQLLMRELTPPIQPSSGPKNEDG